jgi:2-keto-4-pentenoate hydratase
MINEREIENLGRQLADALANRRSIAPVALDDLTAQAVQRAAAGALGQKLAGWKVGATSPAAQANFGTDRPFFGPMPSATAVESGGTLPWAPGMRGAECELAFRLGHDIEPRETTYTEEEIAGFVDEVAIALEIVATRWEQGGKLDIHHAVADFGFNGGFVKGPRIADWRKLDLAGVTARCLVDGEEKGSGTASVVLGSPLKSLTWLANQGVSLRAGQWVSTGTITGLAPIKQGSRVIGDFGGHGRVELTTGG